VSELAWEMVKEPEGAPGRIAAESEESPVKVGGRRHTKGQGENPQP